MDGGAAAPMAWAGDSPRYHDARSSELGGQTYITRGLTRQSKAHSRLEEQCPSLHVQPAHLPPIPFFRPLLELWKVSAEERKVLESRDWCQRRENRGS